MQVLSDSESSEDEGTQESEHINDSPPPPQVKMDFKFRLNSQAVACALQRNTHHNQVRLEIPIRTRLVTIPGEDRSDIFAEKEIRNEEHISIGICT